MGAANMPSSTVATAPKPVDPFDQLLNARRMAARTMQAKQGLQSTFLTTPKPGSILGGGYGGA